jgi:nucleotide-binding universal stress UspA family protein
MSNQESSVRRNIVVGVDGSAASIDALRLAARAAVSAGAQLDVVTSWEWPTSYGTSGVIADWDPAADAAQILAQAIEAAFGEREPEGLRSLVCEGHPARVLIEASQDAELLVVGSRGHGGFVGLLLGSVSAYCAEHAACPVLVTRATPQPPAAPTNA